MDLFTAMSVAASGMEAQGHRLRVIAENIANTDSIADQPGTEPYRRKVVTFSNVLDQSLDAQVVRVDRVMTDDTPFELRFDPQHPAADERGYVQMPNVNVLTEMMDMRQAQRSYEANLGSVDAAKRMLRQTIEMLRR